MYARYVGKSTSLFLAVKNTVPMIASTPPFWQRERKKEYNTDQRIEQARKIRRTERQKVCAYCLRPFWSETASNLCSDYCREHQKRIRQCEADIRRGQPRDMKKYLNARDEYREKIKNTPLTDRD